MASRKYHLILGLACLCISIILPTITYHFFISIDGLSLLSPIAFTTTLIEVILFGFLVFLLMVWLAALYFAVLELGGYMLHLGQPETENRHMMHQSFCKDYLNSH